MTSKDKDKEAHDYATTRATPPATPAQTDTVPPEDLLTEQEQDVVDGGNGVGPMPLSEATVPVDTMEDLGIGPKDPYPTGNPPTADAETTRAQAVKDRPPKSGPDKTVRKGE